jgi:hypothetical protein
MLAVIFLHVQKSKTNFQSHYFLAMSLSRRQRRCPQCTFWFSSLSRHYQYSPRCNLTRSSSPCFSSDDDGDDMMAAAIPDDLSFQPQAGFISTPPSSQSQEPSAAPSIPHLGQPVNNSLQDVSLPANVLVTPPSDIEVSLPANASVTHATGLESGKAFLLPATFDKGRYCFTNNDRAMMRFYSLCDNAGSPRYLMDQVLAQLRIEISRNQFDPSNSSLTKRDAFMSRMHRKFRSYD